jgi:2-amino-4-hydroxy-6-hydroxymethyldihydropteridine diphosphokinase
MDSLLNIEKEMGRIRNEKFGARTIDLDILFYDDCIMENENVIIPHPRITQRRFVLVPLAEIAAELVDPVSQKKISKLLIECPDQLAVRDFSPNVYKNDL